MRDLGPSSRLLFFKPDTSAVILGRKIPCFSESAFNGEKSIWSMSERKNTIRLASAAWYCQSCGWWRVFNSASSQFYFLPCKLFTGNFDALQAFFKALSEERIFRQLFCNGFGGK
jgi:hypothetical protein